MNKQPTEQQRKKKGLKAGIIAFGATALIYALIFPLYRLSDFLLCGGMQMPRRRHTDITGFEKGVYYEENSLGHSWGRRHR